MSEKRRSSNSRVVSFFLGSLYELSGYAHFTIEVKLSAYRNVVKGGCAALHTVAKAAHNPGMAHLYHPHAVKALKRRCKRLERAANSQLWAMVREQYYDHSNKLITDDNGVSGRACTYSRILKNQGNRFSSKRGGQQ